ncbi:SAM-dependent methyltransferase [Glycomyces sp. YM15]|uniref:SAM-dependent methyltransferase n=1 Tax=Glycomyces sp. YM15 TaxID=2800446 RepID=UPI001962693B|nr:SAM-dependent methyltransferase [Glycomyces sp. YM15]
MPEEFTVRPVAHVIGGREQPTDDYWGGTKSIIRIDDPRFDEESTRGLEEFTHLEVVFYFHLTDPADLHFGARAARDNPEWPKVGVFGHRNMRRVNWLGVSRCKLLKVDRLDLHVEDLDAVDGTPILDIKPWFAEMGPQGETGQPSWVTAMLVDYFAPKQT